MKRVRKLYVIITMALLLYFILLYACTFNDEDSNKPDVDGTECDIKCYKDFVSDIINCFHEECACAERGEESADCVEAFCNCYVTAEANACRCAKSCRNYLQDVVCPCLNNCKPYCEHFPPNYNCSYDCWQKICDSGWFDCDCFNQCFDKYKECTKNIQYPPDEDDYQRIHKCLDNLETCWLGCIAE